MNPRHLIITLSFVLAASLGFLGASCGAGDGAEAVGPVPSVSEKTSGGETATSPATETTTVAEEEPAATVTYQVWFARGEGESLHVAYRSQTATPRVGTAAVEALLDGPDPSEQANGVFSAIPSGTQLLGLTIDDGIASIDLTSEFESGGGTLSMTMRLAQIVCTLDQFPTVKGVLFKLDGQPVDVFSGEGIVLDHPVKCGDYEDVLPAIVVAGPVPGQRVGNPVKVSGTSNVFEANVTIRILDADDNEIARTFTTATCGTGCRGTFSTTLAYDVDSEQQGTIVVEDDDAAGTGTPPHQVFIPVTLTPSA